MGAEAIEASRAAVRRVIGNYFPLDSVLDREVPAGLPSSGRTWLVDPLGGTLNFVLGLGLWSVSVAAVQGGEVVAGAVWVPPDVLHAAWAGGPALRGGSGIRPSAVSAPEDAIVSVAVPPGLSAAGAAAVSECVRRVGPRVRGVRVFCSVALELCCVASGKLDACVCPFPVPLGAAAAALVARQAGCGVLGFDGRPYRTGESQGLLTAATPVLAEALLGLLFGIRWEEEVPDPG